MWIIQSNMNYEVGVDNIIDYLTLKNIAFELVDIFKGKDHFYYANTDTIFDIHDRNDVFAIGSYRLSRMLTEKNITPTSFSNENYNYSKWVEHWGNKMLNSNFIIQSINNLNIPDDWEHVFARPLNDNKLFTGGLFRKHDLLIAIHGKILNAQNKEDKIIISKKKEIHSEYRLFVINNKVIAGSMYKMRNQAITSEFVDNSVISFADECLSLWSPSKAFALDIAITDEGLKIVEVNNICSAGLYKSDVTLIVDALEELKPH